MSLLKPGESVGVGLATATLVYAIHTNATPTAADIRSLDRANKDVDKSERVATWTSAALVSAISLLVKDPTIFVIGGLSVIAMAWWTRYDNQVDPVSGRATTVVATPKQTQSEAPEMYSAPPAPLYDANVI